MSFRDPPNLPPPAKIAWKVVEWPAYRPDMNPIENLWAILKATITKTENFLGKFRRKVYEIWNEVDADVVRNLYETYANRLLDVQKAKAVIPRY